MMNGHEKSDRPIVPTKSPNKTGIPVAEEMEGRGLTKGNSRQQNTSWTQSRTRVRSARQRIREAAKKDRRMQFTSLYHHIYDVDALRDSFYSLNRNASAGVDGETWKLYEERLEDNLQNLSARLRRGAYKAKPVQRVFIPKTDGRKRPLGVPTLEDKIVQRSAVEVLNAIYENDFAGFSYGFRPGRSQHNALDALYVGITRRKVNWVFDADIRGFFDAIDHEWLIKFVEHRIADQRVVRLVRKWLSAGVLEDGKWTRGESGTPQGGSVSPLLANIYLHYVFDCWVHQWRQKRAKGDMVVVRFADDNVVGFQYKAEAEQFQRDLKERLQKFSLELHPEKTRLVEFGRYAASDRRRRGLGKPETFNFLGFTHICGKTKNDKFSVFRQTNRRRLRVKLGEVKTDLRRRMHRPIHEVGKWLGSVVRGHLNYFAVPTNGRALNTFREQVIRHWLHTLRRRGQKKPITWERMKKLTDRWLPTVRIIHPYPSTRLRARPKVGAG